MNSRAVYRYRRTGRRVVRTAAYRHHVEQYILVLLMAVAASLLLILFFHGVHAQASSEPGVTKFKYYQNVMIDSEMSLDDYAAEYADPVYYSSEEEYIREVVGINHLQTISGEITGITPGTHLIIPYYSAGFHK